MRIDTAVETIRTCLDAGNKVLICGNGGSAAQSDHFAAEMVGSGLPCIALTNPAVITALANDFGYEYVFVAQIDALGKPGDVLITLTTSGESNNIHAAKVAAYGKGMSIIELPNKGNKRDYRLFWNEQDIQEEHIALLHRIWKGLIDENN